MILTVDIGNSRIKWASWQAGEIVTQGVAAYAVADVAVVLDGLFSGLEKPARVFAVCVAGNKLSQELSEWSKQHWRLDVAFLKTEKRYKNVVNAYDEPEQHGVDRWAAVVSAHQNNPGYSVCVISAGTALTFDLINKDGQHLGGYILPSFVTMHKALLLGTANVGAELSMQFHERSMPNNTNDAVNQGLHRLLRAGIREICQSAKQEMDSPVKVVISGGSAEAILGYPDMPAMVHQPDLVMQGLYEIMTQRTLERG